MHRIIYKTSLVLGSCILLATILFVCILLSKIGANSGNAGAFLAVLSMGAAFVGVGITTLLALSAGVVAVFSNKSPNSGVYSYWWPTLLATPGLLIIVFLVVSWLKNGL